MKKIKLAFLIITILAAANFSVSKGMEVYRKNNGIFKFEDYKTKEEAQEALLKLHPIGSPVDELIKTLNGAGASTRDLQDKEIYNEWRKDDFLGAVGYQYEQGSTFLTTYNWGGAVLYNTKRQIISLGISKHYMGL